MKNIKEITWNVDEATYRADVAYSYSAIARFSREGFRCIPNLYDEISSPSITFGSAVDCLLTEGIQVFKEKFVVCNFQSISDSLITIIKDLHSIFKSDKKTLKDISDEAIHESCIKNNYYVKDSYRNYRLKLVRDESCAEYYDLLQLSENRTVLKMEEFDIVVKTVNELKTNPYTCNLFKDEYLNPHLERLYQAKFKIPYEGVELKCMFDFLIVDHENKIIYPNDLKTTSSNEEDFTKSFIHWRYDIQAKLYTYILQEVISQDEYFKDFRIVDYSFVVINKNNLSPLIFTLDSIYCQTTEDIVGIDENSKETILKDWRVILDDLIYYKQTSNLKYSREAVDSSGNIPLNIKLANE